MPNVWAWWMNEFTFPEWRLRCRFVRACYKSALWIDLLYPETLRSYIAWPERLFDVVRWAIEVKNATKVHSIDTKPLEEFLTDYPMAMG